jgi:hypothetical protein
MSIHFFVLMGLFLAMSCQSRRSEEEHVEKKTSNLNENEVDYKSSKPLGLNDGAVFTDKKGLTWYVKSIEFEHPHREDSLISSYLASYMVRAFMPSSAPVIKPFVSLENIEIAAQEVKGIKFYPGKFSGDQGAKTKLFLLLDLMAIQDRHTNNIGYLNNNPVCVDLDTADFYDPWRWDRDYKNFAEVFVWFLTLTPLTLENFLKTAVAEFKAELKKELRNEKLKRSWEVTARIDSYLRFPYDVHIQRILRHKSELDFDILEELKLLATSELDKSILSFYQLRHLEYMKRDSIRLRELLSPFLVPFFKKWVHKKNGDLEKFLSFEKELKKEVWSPLQIEDLDKVSAYMEPLVSPFKNKETKNYYYDSVLNLVGKDIHHGGSEFMNGACAELRRLPPHASYDLKIREYAQIIQSWSKGWIYNDQEALKCSTEVLALYEKESSSHREEF